MLPVLLKLPKLPNVAVPRCIPPTALESSCFTLLSGLDESALNFSRFVGEKRQDTLALLRVSDD